MVMWLVLGASWIFAVIKTNSDTSFCLGAFERPDYNTTLSREKKHCHLFTFRRRCRFLLELPLIIIYMALIVRLCIHSLGLMISCMV